MEGVRPCPGAPGRGFPTCRPVLCSVHATELLPQTGSGAHRQTCTGIYTRAQGFTHVPRQGHTPDVCIHMCACTHTNIPRMWTHHTHARAVDLKLCLEAQSEGRGKAGCGLPQGCPHGPCCPYRPSPLAGRGGSTSRCSAASSGHSRSAASAAIGPVRGHSVGRTGKLRPKTLTCAQGWQGQRATQGHHVSGGPRPPPLRCATVCERSPYGLTAHDRSAARSGPLPDRA